MGRIFISDCTEQARLPLLLCRVLHLGKQSCIQRTCKCMSRAGGMYLPQPYVELNRLSISCSFVCEVLEFVGPQNEPSPLARSMLHPDLFLWQAFMQPGQTQLPVAQSSRLDLVQLC